MSKVVSAFDLADSARDRLAEVLGRKLERQVNVRTSTDSNLLGGVLIRAGDLVIDGPCAASWTSWPKQ